MPLWLSPLSRFRLTPRGSHHRVLVPVQITLIAAQASAIYYLSTHAQSLAGVAAASFVIQLLIAVFAGHPTKILALGAVVLALLCVKADASMMVLRPPRSVRGVVQLRSVAAGGRPGLCATRAGADHRSKRRVRIPARRRRGDRPAHTRIAWRGIHDRFPASSGDI